MKCDLCKHETALPNTLLCAPCSEMVQRLIVVEGRLQNLEQAQESRVLSLPVAAAGSLK